MRDVTRRRGVGQYLIEEVIRENPSVTSVDGRRGRGGSRRDGSVYAGVRVYGAGERVGEAQICAA